MGWLKDMERKIKKWKKKEDIHEKIMARLMEELPDFEKDLRVILQLDGVVSVQTATKLAKSVIKELVRLAERILK